MILRTQLGKDGYDIVIERGVLGRAGEFFAGRRAVVATDDGVPPEYARKVASAFGAASVFTFPQGEASKNIDVYSSLLAFMAQNGLTRSDCVAAVGGGVVGDLAGFAAATYMRGIDFYNVPTTLLSQIDSSVGGKTAIDFMGYKNIVGAFHQPKKVLIDPDALSTLPPRQISNGLAEAIKMSLTSDADAFALFESGAYKDDIEDVIIRSLKVKKSVVEQDEREKGLRRILNFGHTLGHAIESASDLYHGECVALGMLPMTARPLRGRLKKVLTACGLPIFHPFDLEKALCAVDRDKKKSGGSFTAVYVNEPGNFEMKETGFAELEKGLRALSEGNI